MCLLFCSVLILCWFGTLLLFLFSFSTSVESSETDFSLSSLSVSKQCLSLMFYLQGKEQSKALPLITLNLSVNKTDVERVFHIGGVTATRMSFLTDTELLTPSLIQKMCGP